MQRMHFLGTKNDRQIKKLLSALSRTNIDDVEREALTAMRSTPFDRTDRHQNSHRHRHGNDHNKRVVSVVSTPPQCQHQNSLSLRRTP
ncbi:MAG: hypothetical protein OXI96_05045 [Acidimicrobiaceae bacterium]|nr:hypothetical protein [Acidimicrobiaceae bacterium]